MRMNANAFKKGHAEFDESETLNIDSGHTFLANYLSSSNRAPSFFECIGAPHPCHKAGT